jgi:predicted nucleic acid-binding protein
VSLVIDASITLAWIFESERTVDSEAALSRTVQEGAVVPSLWKLEVAHVLQMAVRKGRIDRAARTASLDDLLALPITVDDETDARAWADTLLLAESTGLTLYDAAYLELAIRLQCPLATSDKALCTAAAARGVQLLGG